MVSLLVVLHSSHLPAVDTFDEKNKLVCTNQFSLYIRGIGGFGGPANSPAIKVWRVRSF
jgi:hypothetical protein